MDQIWSGINFAKVLVAELTSRNPNVFYELALHMHFRTRWSLSRQTDQDVPFDLKHIRVIYYDVNTSSGNKLIEKVAENILSAIEKPGEALLKRPGGG